MGNVEVDHELMRFVIIQMLPNLYSLDLFNLKIGKGIKSQATIFDSLKQL